MTPPATSTLPPDATAGDLFGHPRGLSFLFATEMWERFSYYGMRALLVLYMTNYLLKPERADSVLGLAALRRGLESFAGPLDLQPFASNLYGLYTGLVYLTPILGGFAADRWFGRRRMVMLGAALMIAGHFLMASERLFLLALLLLILGNGAFKPNIVTQVGGLYAANDARRDRAFSIFYVGVNVGAFFSPLICGALGEFAGWHYGFASAGVGMAIGFAIYLVGLRILPQDAPLERKAISETAPDAASRRGLVALALLFIPTALFWAAYEQQGNTLALFAEQFTDRSVDLVFWRGEIPVTWFQAFNPLMIFLFTPPLVAHWSRLARSRKEPASIVKLAAGCFGLAFAYLLLAVAATSEGKASWLWLFAYFVVLTLAELHVWPIVLSLASRLAPSGSRSAAMGAWMTTIFVGNLLAGWLGGFWSTLSAPAFFCMIAAVAATSGVMIALTRGPLRALSQGA
jgi:proton-dependent oligopeptide transporter, POT family